MLPAVMFPLGSPTGAMNPIRDICFRLAISDSAAFHGMLSISALHLTTYYGKQAFQDSVMHNTVAVNLVNQRLNDSVSSVSDGTIAAVCLLLAHDVGLLHTPFILYFSLLSANNVR